LQIAADFLRKIGNLIVELLNSPWSLLGELINSVEYERYVEAL
jgi:hypothetical protein